MKSKKKKGHASFRSDDGSNFSGIQETSLVMDKSVTDVQDIPRHFKVLLQNEHQYSKTIRTWYAVFLHPSIIRAHGSPRYFVVKGAENVALCVPIPLEKMQRTTIVFMKENMGFKQDEVVTIYPYTNKIHRASDVVLVSKNTAEMDEEHVKDEMLNILSFKRFCYVGMEFDVDIMDKHNTLSISKFSTSLSDVLDSSKLFSSLSLRSRPKSGDKSYGECAVEEPSNPPEEEFPIPSYFIVDHLTSIVIQDESGTCQDSAPLATFSQLVGLERQLREIKLSINTCFGSEKKMAILLLTGPSGTGKTLVLDAICNEFKAYIEKIEWFNLYSRSTSDAEQELQQIFWRAKTNNPCIILVDNFDYLCPAKLDAETRPIAVAMSNLLENCVREHIVFIAATNSSNYNAEVLKRSNRGVLEINFTIPDMQEREKIFIKLLNSRKLCLTSEEINACCMFSHGFTGKDVDAVLNEVITLKMLENKSASSEIYKEISFQDILQALKYKKPSIVQSDIKIKEVKWSDIGGMKEIKKKIIDFMEGPFKHPELYELHNMQSPRGILLYGPPGCSKTMIGKAIATEWHMNFISKNVSDLQNKYLGESEKAVKDLFVLARARSPCIIFIDEIDALIPGRESSLGSGVEARIVNTFLQEIDGIKESKNVLIVAATNRPDRLDEAFTRQGRVDHFIYIPLPNFETREEILRLSMKKRTVEEGFDYEVLASKTEGYSGAEIVNVCNEAAFLVLEEDIEQHSAVFTMKHFESVLKSIRPRTSLELIEFYKNFNAKYQTS